MATAILLRACAPEDAGQGRDYRSAKVQAELRRAWRAVIKHKPPAVREQFLKSQEGRSALGAKTCRDLLRLIAGQVERVARATSGAAWVEAFERDGEILPGFFFDDSGHLRGPDFAQEPRRHKVRLLLSREPSRTGMEHPVGTPIEEAPTAGPPTRRWTPPQAVDLEDQMDAMSPKEADNYEGPPSPSAVAIFRIRVYGGQELAWAAGKSHRKNGRSMR